MILDTLQKWFFVVVSLRSFFFFFFFFVFVSHAHFEAHRGLLFFFFHAFAYMIPMNSYTSSLHMHKCKRFIYTNNLLMMRSYVCNPLLHHSRTHTQIYPYFFLDKERLVFIHCIVIQFIQMYVDESSLFLVVIVLFFFPIPYTLYTVRSACVRQTHRDKFSYHQFHRNVYLSITFDRWISIKCWIYTKMKVQSRFVVFFSLSKCMYVNVWMICIA